MRSSNIDVLESGAVALGPTIVCDGFLSDRKTRIQTHVHEDHMHDFSTSKGSQQILMSEETFHLLVAEYNADLEYRSNLSCIARGREHRLPDSWILKLLGSNHMLGSCQVAIESPAGHRFGYSGDFGWPLDDVIQVDELVVDSTYGSPQSVRQYSQAEAESYLSELVHRRLRNGSVHIKAHRGTIERVLQILDGSVDVPILASEGLMNEVNVYQMYGYPGGITAISSQESRLINQGNWPHVRLYSKGDVLPYELPFGTAVTISAFMVSSTSPYIEYSERSYKIALSNHADFNETIEYIRASGAKYVVTDNTRTHGVELAIAINERIEGVCAVPSSNRRDRSR